MLIVVEETTALVAAVNVALVAPAGTMTVAGTVAMAALLLASETVLPPAGAGAFKLAVPVEDDPPTTLEGLKLSEPRAGLDCEADWEMLLPPPPQELRVTATATIPTRAGKGPPRPAARTVLLESRPSRSKLAHGRSQTKPFRSARPAGVVVTVT